jgi:hypothetical protein
MQWEERMKTKRTGDKKKTTNLDKLRTCRNENDIDEFVEKLCKKKICPFMKVCPVRLKDGNCLWGVLTDWFFEGAQNE